MKQAAFLTLSLCLLAQSARAQTSGAYQQEIGQGQVNWTGQYIETNGAGAAPAQGNPGQQRLMAQRAATADAYRKLLETVNGVQVTAETVVNNYVTESDVVRTRVQGVIRGATQIGQPRMMSDGTVEVTMRIPLYGALARAIDFGQVVEQQQDRLQRSTVSPLQFPASLGFGSMGLNSAPWQIAQAEGPPSLQAGQPDKPFTGLVIDARGMKIMASMSPVIGSRSKQVYVGKFDLDIDKVISEGIVVYFSDLDKALASPRAGAHPLVVRPIDTGKTRVDFILNAQDADQIAAYDQRDQFLKNLQVVAVLD